MVTGEYIKLTGTLLRCDYPSHYGSFHPSVLGVTEEMWLSWEKGCEDRSSSPLLSHLLVLRFHSGSASHTRVPVRTLNTAVIQLSISFFQLRLHCPTLCSKNCMQHLALYKSQCGATIPYTPRSQPYPLWGYSIDQRQWGIAPEVTLSGTELVAGML